MAAQAGRSGSGAPPALSLVRPGRTITRRVSGVADLARWETDSVSMELSAGCRRLGTQKDEPLTKCVYCIWGARRRLWVAWVVACCSHVPRLRFFNDYSCKQ
eukprot:6356635-Prymnesium_polylepis.1